MRLDNGFCDGKPHSKTFILGRHKRIENLSGIFGKSNAVVFNSNKQFLLILGRDDFYDSVTLPVRTNGITCIPQQIQKYLDEQNPVSLNQG